ncbi:MAG: transcription elongation factor GreA [Candidatus Abawacabacteria bacterium]|nr:transcription elongation factor GreA [Candidatus Abawacabacteria bacterium]
MASTKLSKNARPKTTKATRTQAQEEVLLTKEGLDALVIELNTLKTVRRKEVAQRLKEAISYGDLSENAEYTEARDEQAFVEGRILQLEQQIKNAKIISGTKKHVTIVQIGHSVVLKNLISNQKETYVIVGSTEADPLNGKISNESPVGKSILGKEVGSKVDVLVPEGHAQYEILSIE